MKTYFRKVAGIFFGLMTFFVLSNYIWGDPIKIHLAYILSFILGALAYFFEGKKKQTQ